jgi:hypothetical protein
MSLIGKSVEGYTDFLRVILLTSAPGVEVGVVFASKTQVAGQVQH